MKQWFSELADQYPVPVLVTDRSGKIILKNKCAYALLKSVKLSSSIAPHIRTDCFFVREKSCRVSLVTLFSELAPIRLALALELDDGDERFTLWIFDRALSLVRPESAEAMLSELAESVLPYLDKLLKKNSFSAAAKNKEIDKLVNSFYDKVFIENGRFVRSAASPVTHIPPFIRDSVIRTSEAVGIPCIMRTENTPRRAQYINFAEYMLAFLQVFSLVLNNARGGRFESVIRYGAEELFTSFIFTPKNPAAFSRAAGLGGLKKLFPEQTLSILTIEALARSLDFRASFEVDPAGRIIIRLEYPTFIVFSSLRQSEESKKALRFIGEFTKECAAVISLYLKSRK